MSIIVAKKTKKGIEIAWDSQVNAEDYIYPTTRGWTKVEEVVNGACIGSVGRLDYILWFREYVNNTLDGLSLDDYSLSNWYRQWLKEVNETGFNITDDQTDSIEHILVISPSIFWITDKGTVTDIEDYVAIGSGRLPAEVVLWKGGGAKEAVEAAIKFDKYCGGEISSLIL